jgi:hypothetical protein
VAGPEKVHCALYPQVLEEGEWRLAQHTLHPACQGALAGGPSCPAERKFDQRNVNLVQEVTTRRPGRI